MISTSSAPSREEPAAVTGGPGPQPGTARRAATAGTAAGTVLSVGAALAVLSAATLAVTFGGRRGGKRRAAHAKAPEPRAGGKAGAPESAGTAYAADSWVGSPGPRGPGSQPHPPWDDYSALPTRPRPASGRAPGRPIIHPPARVQPPPARPAAFDDSQPSSFATRPTVTPRIWDPGPASFPAQARQYGHPSGPMPQYGHPSGPMPQQGHPSGPMPQYGSPSGMAVQFAAEGPADLLERYGRESGKLWTVDSVRLANQILSTANHQAAEIRQEAHGQAEASLADAQQEAAELIRRAAAQADAKLATAEQEAAELRATVAKLSAELGDVAAYVTKSLPGTTRPAAKPASKPAAKPAARPASAPVTKPGISPRRIKPEPRPAGKPKNRQISAMRKVMASFVLLFLVGVAIGGTELALHGGPFFIFRANGAGASVTGPEEDQGPGQPNAPGAQHNTNAPKAPAKPKH